jgi:hypothetical protein
MREPSMPTYHLQRSTKYAAQDVAEPQAALEGFLRELYELGERVLVQSEDEC